MAVTEVERWLAPNLAYAAGRTEEEPNANPA